jgi:xylulokinase
MPSCTLGIDIGTSAVKALALSDSGQVLAKSRQAYPTHAPVTNWAEQTADDWWTASKRAVAGVMKDLDGVPIDAIGLSGQLNGFVLADEAGTPLHDALIWLDLRGGAEADELERQIGGDIEAVTGNRVSPIAVLPKLLWMRRHRPELMAQARRLFFVKDFVMWRLAGVHATDPSDGSATNLMALKARRWSERLCAAAGIDPGLLPTIVPSAAIAGRVTPEAALDTGLAAGTPVAPGAGDVTALAVGCGVLEDGVLGVTLGTAGHVVLSSSTMLSGIRGLWQIAHVPHDTVIWLGLVMSGGLSLAWLHRTLSIGPSQGSFESFVELADGVEPGARGLAFLPFLEGAATPYEQPGARAVFAGLTSSHGAPEMVRAVMEGVAYNIRECVDLFETSGGRVGEVRLAEGGARLAQWCQMIADVLGRPVALVEESDTSALGAAIMARVAATGDPLPEVARRAVRLGRRFRPDPVAGRAYEGAFRRYRDLAALHLQARDARAEPGG